MSQRIRVLFEPLGRMGDANPGESILDVAIRCGAGLRSECGYAGTCGKCRVIVEDQKGLSKVDDAEARHFTPQELSKGYRLACTAKLLPTNRKITVNIPSESLQRARRFSGVNIEHKVSFNPLVTEHPDEDAMRLLLGLAIDIGTSRVTARLIDLGDGSTFSSESMENPQIVYGENLITRASYAQASDESCLRLRVVRLEAVNTLIERLTAPRKLSPLDIVQVVVVGNTVMHHLFLGLDTTKLTRAPFPPATREMVWLTGRESGLIVNPRCIVSFLPNIDAFVGADAVADIISSNLLRRAEPTLLLDVGTNTELMLRAGGEILACSCASGPAFEGEHIEHGMKAVEGAIEGIRIRGEVVEYDTIGGGKPVGICGSGVVDAIAELLRGGLVSGVGRFTEAAAPRIIRIGNQRKFVIASGVESDTGSDITVSERDINEVILAKAAISSATGVLMAMKGVEPGDLKRVLVAGAFGGHLDKVNAKTIGLIPQVENRRIEFLGNAALEGATMALKSRRILDHTTAIAEETRYVELASNPDFDAGFRKVFILPSAKRY
jgi:uncharacterized 2Fe-2S/4Fe-4S cluster protein (DUF4445 family)